MYAHATSYSTRSRAAPRARLLYDRVVPFHARSHARTLEEAWQAARDCVEYGLDGIDLNCDAAVVTPELVAWLHARGKLVAVWVWRAPAANDTPEHWAAMRAAGVDYFTSNLPAELEGVPERCRA